MLALVFVAGTLLAAVSARAAEPAYLLEEFGRGTAIIETSGYQCLLINLYLADTGAQHARGLMYVRELGETEGMLFRYPTSARLTMWMKNTYVALDMLFIEPDGTIAQIASNTTPLSTERISSRSPASAVLELNAGFTERWQIAAGNRLLSVTDD